MNLPATSIEFLDSIPSLHLQNCIIFCYGFSPYQDAHDLVEKALILLQNKYQIDIRKVRDVAPKKLMFCLSIHILNEKKRLLTSDDSFKSKRKINE